MKKTLFNLALACGALFAGGDVVRSQPLSLHTLAGNLGQGSADGVGSNARFDLPISVATDSAGNVYVTDTGNSTIRKITPDGAVSTFAGWPAILGSDDGTGTNAQFLGPQGIAVDSANFLYVADTANATIRRISPAGAVSTLAGAAGEFNSFDGAGPAARFFQPGALAVDNGGTVYVADAWNHTIRKIMPAGVVSTLAGLAGNFGAADGTNSKARFQRPAGITVDAATNLFVTDSLNHTIRKITPGGAVSTIAGLAGVWGSVDGTNSSARFFQPQGIVAANASTLFVVDSGNQTLRKLSAVGTNWVVTTVAGVPGTAGFNNGTGSAAQFHFPAGVALNGSGELYVADSGNNGIRTTRIVPPTLIFSTSPNQFILSWPTSADGFVLETSPMLEGVAVWSPLTNGVVILGDNFVRTNGLDAAMAFYRLHRP